MKRRWICVLLLLPACSGSTGHPLDDSETRPPDAAAALTEAKTTLRDVGDALLPGMAHEDTEWQPDVGCGTADDAPEQGDVGRILYARYLTLPDGRTEDEVVEEAQGYWEGQGHAVASGSSSMPRQAITRINGISYAVVVMSPGVEVRAFLPCYET